MTLPLLPLEALAAQVTKRERDSSRYAGARIGKNKFLLPVCDNEPGRRLGLALK
jgi:hypothetical protein